MAYANPYGAPTFDQSRFGSFNGDPMYGDSQFGDWGMLNFFNKPGWDGMNMGSPNYQMSNISPDHSSFDVLLKNGEKQGGRINYALQNGQYVPVSDSGNEYWNSNPTNDNRGLLSVLGGAALGAAGAAYGGTLGGAGDFVGGAGMNGAGIVAEGGGGLGAGAVGGGYSPAGTGGQGGFAPGENPASFTYGGSPAGGMATTGAGGMATSGAVSGAGGGLGGAAGGAASAGGLGGAMSGLGDWASTIGQWGSGISNWLPIASAIAGGIQGSQNQTTTSGPPDYLRNAGQAAASIPFQPYPAGQRNEPLNADQQAAMAQVRQRAAGPGGVTNPMFGMDNPYTNKAIADATGDIERNFNRTTRPMLDQMNSRANTGFGTSSAMDEMRTGAYADLNKQTGQVANDMRMQDLRAQQQMGEGYANRAPAMQQMDYRNAEALLGVGNQQQAFGQTNRDFDYTEFMRALQYPDVQLGRLGVGAPNVQTTPGAGWFNGALGGYFGGMGVNNVLNRSTTPPPPNPYSYGNGNQYDPTGGTEWGR